MERNPVDLVRQIPAGAVPSDVASQLLERGSTLNEALFVIRRVFNVPVEEAYTVILKNPIWREKILSQAGSDRAFKRAVVKGVAYLAGKIPLQVINGELVYLGEDEA